VRQIVRTQEHNRPARDRRATYSRTQRQRRFQLEALEERRLMTIPASVTNVNGDLIVNTQEGASSDVELNLNLLGGELVTLNGKSYGFLYGAINQVTVNLNGNNDTLDISSTTWQAPVTVNDGAGTDFVTFSPYDQNLDFISGNVNVIGGSGYDTLTIDDQSYSYNPAYTMTGSSFTRSGAAAISYSEVDLVTVNGSNSAASTYNVQDTEFVFTTKIYTGTGGNTVNVQGSSGPFYITSGGNDTVNLGSAGDVQNIQEPVYIDNEGGLTALNINDSTDSTPQTVSLDTFTPAGDTPWGSVSGLAPGGGPIDYRYSAVSSVSITTGSGGDTVNVHATDVSAITNLTSVGGADTVNVGNAGSVQDIAGPLNIENPNSFTTLDVDDSADSSGHTVTLDTFTPVNDSPWDSITGLAPAPIQYEYGDTSSLSITTGLAADTVDVHATGVTTNISSAEGFNWVYVGNAGSAQGILGTLNIESPLGFSTLSVDDSADQSGHTVALYTFTPSGDSPWGAITGFGSATINYEYADIASPVTIKGGLGGNTFNVSALPPQTVDLYTGGGNDKVNVETTSGSLVVNGQGGTNTLVGPNGNETWHITGTNAGSVGGVSFSNVQNLIGGTGNDLFVFSNGKGVTGTVNGGGGTNELDYAFYTTAVTVNLASHTATGTGGFANIATLVGGTGANKLVGPNATNTWNITSTNGGNVAGVTFSAFANLIGGTGVDVFKFSAGKGVTGKINGGGGGDWLDYASYTTPVTVNLATGAATGVGGGVTNVPNVRGGVGTNTLTGNAQGNILIGGAGTNIITGGSGRSILIGDTGAATIKGGAGDDIVIGGYTNYDTSSKANDIALEAILAEWRSADSYTTRISKIKAGLPGGYKLVWGTTVHDNGKVDTLAGGGGMNWFFKGTKDKITDYHSGEQIN
jgi:hypothetical protein